MVFSTTNLFKGIVCPQGTKCRLTSCIYAHDGQPEEAKCKPPSNAAPASSKRQTQPAETTNVEPAAKRRKLDPDSQEETPSSSSRADRIPTQLAAEKRALLSSPQDPLHVSKSPAPKSSQPPQSLAKAVTPPPISRRAPRSAPSASANKPDHQTKPPAGGVTDRIEALNPRLIGNDPVGHPKRTLFLKYLHSEFERLNQQVKLVSMPGSKEVKYLTDQQLITMVLDLEEKLARETGAVYSNVIKQRIAAYKKATPEAWITEVRASLVKEEAKPAQKAEKVIETGLSLEQEALILPQLVADQNPLAAFGYVTKPPTAEQAAEAKAAVEASRNWEMCERCSARFQVFPDRNEEGKLCGQAPCVFHPNRKVFPQRTKTHQETGNKEAYYPCCGETVGAPGCTAQDEHVFNTKSPARLASVLPFIETPDNPAPAKDPRGRTVIAVTFDCEMGYTVNGLELIRMTAISWPANEPLVDVLVRPLGAIIDLNSRFSGIFPEHYVNAIPYDQWKAQSPATEESASTTNTIARLPIVDSPAKARELLCSFLTPQTPLMGHAIDNDLNTVRLCHPTIIDTCLLFPHHRGLPMRLGLRALTQRYLDRAIQTGGAQGHDSLEDSIATADLVRVRVGQKWKELRLKGWEIGENQLIAPKSPQRKWGKIERRERKGSGSGCDGK